MLTGPEAVGQTPRPLSQDLMGYLEGPSRTPGPGFSSVQALPPPPPLALAPGLSEGDAQGPSASSCAPPPSLPYPPQQPRGGSLLAHGGSGS